MQLKNISFKELLLSRLKKLILDMTSVKFETIIFVAYGMWVGKIDTIPGLAYMAAAVGIKEIADFKEKQQVLSNGEYLKKGGD